MGTGNAEKQLLFCDTFTHEGEEVIFRFTICYAD